MQTGFDPNETSASDYNRASSDVIGVFQFRLVALNLANIVTITLRDGILHKNVMQM